MTPCSPRPFRRAGHTLRGAARPPCPPPAPPPQPLLPLLEPLHPGEGVAEDQQGPRVAHDLQGGGDRAAFVGVVSGSTHKLRVRRSARESKSVAFEDEPM